MTDITVQRILQEYNTSSPTPLNDNEIDELAKDLSSCDKFSTQVFYKSQARPSSGSNTLIFFIEIKQMLRFYQGKDSGYVMKVYIPTQCPSYDIMNPIPCLDQEMLVYRLTNEMLADFWTRNLVMMIASNQNCTFNQLRNIVCDPNRKSNCMVAYHQLVAAVAMLLCRKHLEISKSTTNEEEIKYNFQSVYPNTVPYSNLEKAGWSHMKIHTGGTINVINNAGTYEKAKRYADEIIDACKSIESLTYSQYEEMILKSSLSFFATKTASVDGKPLEFSTWFHHQIHRLQPDSHILDFMYNAYLLYSYMYQILFTIFTLQEKGITHNDIHTGNILIDDNFAPYEQNYAIYLSRYDDNTYTTMVYTDKIPRIFDYDHSSVKGQHESNSQTWKIYGIDVYSNKRDFLKFVCYVYSSIHDKISEFSRKKQYGVGIDILITLHNALFNSLFKVSNELTAFSYRTDPTTSISKESVPEKLQKIRDVKIPVKLKNGKMTTKSVSEILLKQKIPKHTHMPSGAGSNYLEHDVGGRCWFTDEVYDTEGKNLLSGTLDFMREPEEIIYNFGWHMREYTNNIAKYIAIYPNYIKNSTEEHRTNILKISSVSPEPTPFSASLFKTLKDWEKNIYSTSSHDREQVINLIHMDTLPNDNINLATHVSR